jgi:outer membrane protein OmpA-like peptidoglycan-associated protein
MGRRIALYLAALGVSGCASAPLRPETGAPPGAILQDADQATTSLATAIHAHLQRARAEIAVASKMEREANHRSDGMWAPAESDPGLALRDRDYAYIASRLELAEATALADLDRQTILRAVRAGVFMGGPHPELVATEEEWTTRPKSESGLATELTQLSAIAPVREETRGLVLALDARELFITGTYALMSEAKDALQHVAATLIAQSGGQPILVEGYCGNPGSETTTQPLALDQANAVRDYLVARGVQPERMRALGLNLPAVGSYTEENASNRCWVEIVILSTSLAVQ